MQEIVIRLEGGIVQDIRTTKLAGPLKVFVRDYDLSEVGLDDGRAQEDEQGESYVEAEHEFPLDDAVAQLIADAARAGITEQDEVEQAARKFVRAARLIENYVAICPECGPGDRFEDGPGEEVTCRECGLYCPQLKDSMWFELDAEGLTNGMRAAYAMGLLDTFAHGPGEVAGVRDSNAERLDLHQQNMSDLLANLRHLCDLLGISWSHMLARAEGHYTEEVHAAWRTNKEQGIEG